MKKPSTDILTLVIGVIVSKIIDKLFGGKDGRSGSV